MATNILYFIFFSAIIILFFYAVPANRRKYILFLGNFIFYWIVAGPKPFLLLILVTLYSYYAAELARGKSKSVYFLFLLPVLGSLILCKYFSFFARGITRGLSVFGLEMSGAALQIILPIGISFYTLKMISYMTDRYDGRLEKASLWDYCIYIMNFTQILSGPIQRPENFLSQLSSEKEWNPDNASRGIYRILLGLFKKLVIANRCAGYVEAVFPDPGTYPAIALWLAAFLFTIELYADFSGYSDIAIGLSQILGFHTEENFRQPYFSSNIKEFWTRWHISLSSWLKDYVYIKLGGNRCSKFRRACNILITFAVSGAWHGNGWNYMVWGLIHGILNLITPSKEIIKKTEARLPLKILSVFATFCCTSFAWIFFHAGSLKNAFLFIRLMVTNVSLSYSAVSFSVLPFTGDNTCIVFAIILFVFIFFLFMYELLEYKQSDILLKKGFCVTWQTFMIVSVVLFGVINASGFIYAQF